MSGTASRYQVGLPYGPGMQVGRYPDMSPLARMATVGASTSNPIVPGAVDGGLAGDYRSATVARDGGGLGGNPLQALSMLASAPRLYNQVSQLLSPTSSTTEGAPAGGAPGGATIPTISPDAGIQLAPGTFFNEGPRTMSLLPYDDLPAALLDGGGGLPVEGGAVLDGGGALLDGGAAIDGAAAGLAEGAGSSWLASAMPVLGPLGVLATAGMGAWMAGQVPEGSHGGNIYYRPSADGFLEIADSAFNRFPGAQPMQQAQQQVSALNDWLRTNNYRFNQIPSQEIPGGSGRLGAATSFTPGSLFNTAYGEEYTNNPSNLFDHVGWRAGDWLRGLTPEAQSRLDTPYAGWNSFVGAGGPQWGDSVGYHIQRPERDQMEQRMAGGIGSAGFNPYDQRVGQQMYSYFMGHDLGGHMSPDRQGEADGGWNPDALWLQFAPQQQAPIAAGPTPGPAPVPV